MNNNKFTYDEVPYSSFTFPQTRPDRLATLGAFHGIKTARPEKCRVLELGCGDGTNLISFAYILPDSEFVGIDLSEIHIEKAKKTSAELKLSNLSFHTEDVMNFNRERFGEFDYIISHGLYSWVPDFVREKILQIYTECLAPDGVGYISYNAYPGCHIREMMWKGMQYHTAAIKEPMEKVKQGISFLNFLTAATTSGSLYQAMIMQELSQFTERTVENIFHDDFAELNQPFYFHEFVEQLKPYGLQFLSEVDAFWMEAGGLSPEILKKLDELGDDVVRREQYIDFIKCRPFRSTLICHDDVPINRRPSAGILKDFYIASQIRPEAPDPNLKDNSMEKFVGPEGGVLDVEHRLTKAALIVLERTWSRFVRFEDLIEEAMKLSGDATASDIDQTSEDLLGMFHSGFVYLHRFQPEFALSAGEFPRASAFVHWQLKNKSENITTLSGMNLKPDGDFMRLLLMLLDGTRNRAAITAETAARINSGESKSDELMAQLPCAIEAKLTEFAKLGLLHL